MFNLFFEESFHFISLKSITRVFFFETSYVFQIKKVKFVFNDFEKKNKIFYLFVTNIEIFELFLKIYSFLFLFIIY